MSKNLLIFQIVRDLYLVFMDIVYFKPKNIFCCTYKLTKILKFQFNFNTKVLAVLKHLSYLKDLIDLKQSIFIILLFIIDAIGKQEHYQITMHYEHEVLYSVHNGFKVLLTISFEFYGDEMSRIFHKLFSFKFICKMRSKKIL